MKATHRIINFGKAITCLRCGLTSHHPDDVKHRFCGNCHAYHPIPIDWRPPDARTPDRA